MIKRIFIVIMIGILSLYSNTSFLQYSLGGGVSSFHGLNLPINRYGLNLFFENPRSADNTMLIRASYMFPVKFNDKETVSGTFPAPAQLPADKVSKTTYFAIDGGTRHYFLNDYDIGFSLYGGGHVKGILTSYSASYRLPKGYDIDDFKTSNGYPLNNFERQYSVLFAFGGSVGAKYQLPTRGALTFDFGAEFISRLIDPYGILGAEISPLSFNFNLAYRFDWF